jgi:hypothetical protein
MEKLKSMLERLYWVAVAAVPFVPWYMLQGLQDRLGCLPGSPCFDFGLPFYAEGAVAGIYTGILLWPMCIWHLGGRYLWRRWSTRPAVT